MLWLSTHISLVFKSNCFESEQDGFKQLTIYSNFNIESLSNFHRRLLLIDLGL
jgi:hypothetical protein